MLPHAPGEGRDASASMRQRSLSRSSTAPSLIVRSGHGDGGGGGALVEEQGSLDHLRVECLAGTAQRACPGGDRPHAEGGREERASERSRRSRRARSRLSLYINRAGADLSAKLWPQASRGLRIRRDLWTGGPGRRRRRPSCALIPDRHVSMRPLMPRTHIFLSIRIHGRSTAGAKARALCRRGGLGTRPTSRRCRSIDRP